MTTSIPTQSYDSGATAAPGAAGAGLAALLGPLAHATGGSTAPADFLQLLKEPAPESPGSRAARPAGIPADTGGTAALSPAATPGLETDPETETTAHDTFTRDDLETIAALLASLLPAWSDVQAVPTGGEAEAVVPSAGSPADRTLKITLQTDGMPALAVQLPGKADAAGVVTALEKALAGVEPAASQTPAGPAGVGFSVAGPARPAANFTMLSSPGGVPEAKIAPEKIAAAAGEKIAGSGAEEGTSEKNFLSTRHESVNGGDISAGISVAQTSPDMPAFNNVRRPPPEERELPLSGRETVAPVVSAPAAGGGGSVEVTPAAAPASSSDFAHRAVESVLNLVEVRQAHVAASGVVRLHFRFGGEDLAVRVQLGANGEVYTQFSTDSTELRTALSTEWQVTAGQGGTEGLRLAEPIFTPADSTGTSGQQQFSSSQQHSQQQDRAGVSAWLGWRTPRPDGSADAATAGSEGAPPPAVTSPLSLHLSAVA